MSWLSVALAIPWILLSLPVMYFAGRNWRWESRLIRDGLVVSGLVVEEIPMFEGYNYRIRYEVGAHTYELRTDNEDWSCSLGEVVQVRFLPSEPANGRLDTPTHLRNQTFVLVFTVLFLWGLSFTSLLLGWWGVL